MSDHHEELTFSHYTDVMASGEHDQPIPPDAELVRALLKTMVMGFAGLLVAFHLSESHCKLEGSQMAFIGSLHSCH